MKKNKQRNRIPSLIGCSISLMLSAQAGDISLTNASFEQPGTSKLFNFDSVPGWTCDDAVDSGVESGGSDGAWQAFSWADDGEIYQDTSHTIVSDKTYLLTFSCKSTGDGGPLTARFYSISTKGNRTTRNTAHSEDITSSGSWQTYSVMFTASGNSVGKPLGIGFDNTGGWLAIDDVSVQEVDGSGLESSFGSIDRRYALNSYPSTGGSQSISGSVWRGERYNAQLALWAWDTASDVTVSSSQMTNGAGSSFDVSANFVGYTLADDGGAGCGDNTSRPISLQPDVVDNDTSPRTMATLSTQPVWISVDVPASAPAGNYQCTVTVSAAGQTPVDHTINLEVIDLVLPAPANWEFHLDLWQNPWSIARYHNLPVWSQAHKDAISAQLELLASAGQKVITTTLVHQPWGGQTYDSFESLIEWTKHNDGTWSYDFTRFDEYVAIADAAGITKQINCYSIVAWGDQYAYFDESAGDYVTLTLTPGTQAYSDHWSPFLQAFRDHVTAKGWVDRTVIAMDERGEGAMRAAIDLVKAEAPELKIALAGHYFASLDADIYDWCVHGQLINSTVMSVIQQRKAAGKLSTFYNACGGGAPNMFAFSSLDEIQWYGWYAAASGFDGTLRWAYNSWVEDPFADTRHWAYEAGDTFLVYPGPTTSLRFESLRDGIEDFEKIKILESSLTGQELQDLQSTLASFNVGFYPSGTNAGNLLTQGRTDLTSLSRSAADGGGTPDDTTAPSPSPMSWSVAPYATGSSTIAMTATTASDTSGVEYYFTCVSGEGSDSGWQDSTTYLDQGLTAESTYSYSVIARDKSANQNATSASGTASATTDAATVDLITGLVAHWSFNGQTLDVSDNSNDGTANGGPQFVAGQIGQALDINGGTQSVTIGGTDVSGSWTASIWVKRDTNTSEFATLMRSASSALRLEQWQNSGQVGLTQFGVADHQFAYSAPIGQWVHLTFVGNNTSTTLWVNGAQTSTLNVSIACPMNEIGDSGGSLNAALDDIGIWSRELNQAEIQSLHTDGLAGQSFQDDPPAATPIFAHAIDMGSRKQGPRYYGQATVTVHDGAGNPVEGVTVNGQWSGAANEADSGVTDANGQVALESSGVRNGGTYTFTLTDMVKNGTAYNAGQNVETSDSITAP